VNKRVLLFAVLISGVSSFAYACMMSWQSPGRYGLCGLIAIIGAPGLFVAAVLSIVLQGGHGGGPLAEMLVISTPINFLVYAGLGAGVRATWKMLKRRRSI
jgi:hypothetical protein